MLTIDVHSGGLRGVAATNDLAFVVADFFTEGMAIGGKVFLETMFNARRNAFSPKRIDGARKIRGVRWGGLMAMRDLRG